jgi:hypothetical protein
LSKKEEKAPLNFSGLPDALLSSIEIPVVAEIGTTNISTYEITEIEEEDIISLNQKLNEPLVLTLGYASRIKVQPGIKDGHFGVRILGSTTQKIKSAPIAKPEVEIPEEIPAEKENQEDFELPLEEEEKEEYNDSPENMFEEENNNPEVGGN